MTPQEIKTLLEKDTGWTDTAGNSLLHHAARLGNEALVGQCLRQGVKTLVYNEEHECARDVARIWGYPAIARQIGVQMQLERSLAPASPLVYISMQDIRDKSVAAGINIFHDLARRGMFDAVVSLAIKNKESLTARDLLTKGDDGESALLKICQQGQFSTLMKKELWLKNPADFFQILDTVPKIYSKDTDIESLVGDIRQSRLQSRPQWKGPS